MTEITQNKAETMICPNCGCNNVSEARFCRSCGSPLAVVGDTAFPPPAVSLAAAAYAGFRIRLAAWVIDVVIVIFSTSVTRMLWYNVALGGGGPDPTFVMFAGSVAITLLVPVLYFVLLTGLKGQTLGKMAAGITVVNQEGLVLGLRRAALRETVGKFVSAIGLLLGFLWVGWDSEKQGWHDKMTGAHVVTVKS
ncbi:MAG: hypothetical protein CL694_01915 [Chloroflexi bacterium]|nr:hypothetical protein [Chloroflexota bacterium]MQG57320.1 hypothetical protein [SAR202 cluster bacterium]